MAEKPVSVRIGVVGADKVKAEFTAIASEGKRAFQVIEGGGRSSAMALQNVGYQVQDFAVQVAGGTSATRALAQQLPQLLSGFGLIGVAIGTAVAVLGPFVGQLFETEDRIKGLDEGLKQLEASTKAYQLAAKNAAIPLHELTGKLGEQGVVVKRLYESQLALAELDMAKKHLALKAGLEAAFSSIPNILKQVDALRANLDHPLNTPEVKLQTQEAIDGFLDKLGMSEEAARRVQAALDGLQAAKGPEAAAAAMDTLRQSIVDAAGGYGRLTEEQIALLDRLNSAQDAAVLFGSTDISGALREASKWADELAARVGRALDRADEAARAVAALAGRERDQSYEAVTMKKWGSRAPTAAQTIGGRPFASPADQLKGILFQDEVPDKPTSKRSGGGGGISEAQKKENDLLREAKRVFDQTRTAAEKYAIEQTKLNDLLASGAIDQDTYSRAIKDLKEKFNEAGKAGREMADEVGAALKDIIIKGGDANEVISQLLSSFASSLFDKGWTGLMNSIFPNANGNAFDGGVVQAFAMGGVVSRPTLFGMKSGLGLMGEAGPEAILPLKRINGKLGVMAGGAGGDGVTVNVSINVDASGAVEGVADQVQRAVRAEVPGIVRQAVAGVGAARRRGYAT